MKKLEKYFWVLLISIVTLGIGAFFIPILQERVPENISILSRDFAIYFFVSGLIITVLSIIISDFIRRLRD